jgi:Cu2+-exporting ATPase
VHAAASRRLLDEGILPTRGEGLQALNRIDTVVFDKTGTLTRGTPEIAAVHINPARTDFTPARALRIAASIEASSAHPIARAFQSAVLTGDEADAAPTEVSGARVVPGMGLAATIGNRRYRIGKADFVQTAADIADDADVWLADDAGWVARFSLRDALREGAIDTVRLLQKEGLETAIVSGDSQQAVEAVAGRLGIDSWRARQTPESKLRELESLREGGKNVLMIGDGVNDAPVLAAADVSMTVKGGAELAHSSADLILTGESLGLVLAAREVARRARHLIRQNLTWAVAYNASVMPLAVSGMLKPWMAALGMSLSSLLVVANAARLVRENRPVAAAIPADREEIVSS